MTAQLKRLPTRQPTDEQIRLGSLSERIEGIAREVGAIYWAIVGVRHVTAVDEELAGAERLAERIEEELKELAKEVRS